MSSDNNINVTINRHNYEEYFLLYVDHELNGSERKAVEEFVQQNPDLEEELITLQQSVLHPERQIVFENKASLMKNVPANPVNATNYEEYFILYGDNELTNADKEQVEQFVYSHPQYQQEFELIQQAKLLPDNSIVYPGKTYLYRTEEDDKVIPFAWGRIAVAAAVLLFLGGIGWLISSKNNATGAGPEKPAVAVKTDTPAKANKINTPQPVVQSKDIATVVPERTNKTNVVVRTVTNKKQQAVAPVKNDTPKEDFAINTKKPDDTSNSFPESSVKSVEVIADNHQPKETVHGPASINPSAKLASAMAYTAPSEDLTDGESGSYDPDKKNKMRGIFRKVSRVFNKVTNTGSDNDKGGIRVANFEIALK